MMNQIKINNLTTKLNKIINNATSPQNPSQINAVVAGITTADSTIYLNASGFKDITHPQNTPVTTDSLFCYFSTTKAITTIAILQLYSNGLVDFDTPVKHYAPEISNLQVLDKINDNATCVTHPAQRDITMRMLLTHTSGLSYSFFNENYNKIKKFTGQPDILHVNEEIFKTPLLFEPGTQWYYGLGIDWAGRILEKITGQSLSEYISENIFNPIGMHSCTFHITDPAKLDKIITMHQRHTLGAPVGVSIYKAQVDPEIDMGGHGIFGTVDDYLKFIRVVLNKGYCIETNTQIIKSDILQEFAFKNQLSPPVVQITALPGVDKDLSNDAEFFPGEIKKWTFGFMQNIKQAHFENLPNVANIKGVRMGRPAGSLGWCGLANLYYWIDLENGIGGYWASQVFPCVDESVLGFFDMEATVYDVLNSE